MEESHGSLQIWQRGNQRKEEIQKEGVEIPVQRLWTSDEVVAGYESAVEKELPLLHAPLRTGRSWQGIVAAV